MQQTYIVSVYHYALFLGLCGSHCTTASARECVEDGMLIETGLLLKIEKSQISYLKTNQFQASNLLIFLFEKRLHETGI